MDPPSQADARHRPDNSVDEMEIDEPDSPKSSGKGDKGDSMVSPIPPQKKRPRLFGGPLEKPAFDVQIVRDLCDTSLHLLSLIPPSYSKVR